MNQRSRLKIFLATSVDKESSFYEASMSSRSLIYQFVVIAKNEKMAELLLLGPLLPKDVQRIKAYQGKYQTKFRLLGKATSEILSPEVMRISLT